MKSFAIQLVDNNDSGQLGDLKIEPVRDITGKITSGVVIGDVLNQNQALILTARPGDFKLYPTLGVGFQDALLSENLLEYRHAIRREFQKDGLKVTQLDVYDIKKLKIKAEYNG